MLAKALAKESGATFINIAVSVLTTKWYGESNKLVAGLFGLARKMQPSIIFIDEIDSFLRERGKSDHEATAMIKAEFMTYVGCVQSEIHISEYSEAYGMGFYLGQIEYWYSVPPTAQTTLTPQYYGACPSGLQSHYRMFYSGRKFLSLYVSTRYAHLHLILTNWCTRH